MIELKSMTKKYKNFTAVDSVSFKIPSGKITGLLGVNGAGKSTILKSLATLIQPSDGKILINNIDVVETPLEVQKKIGYVSEFPTFYENMLVKNFLNYCREIREVSLDDMEKSIKLCKLEEVLEKKISTLSKGFRQRLAFAQAIIHNPDVLILDEPTTGLDPIQIVQIRQLIKSCGKNKTVLFSTHIISEAENICDDVIIMDHGKIYEQDSIKNICEKTKSENLEEAFFKILNEGTNKNSEGGVK